MQVPCESRANLSKTVVLKLLLCLLMSFFLICFCVWMSMKFTLTWKCLPMLLIIICFFMSMPSKFSMCLPTL